MDVSTHTLNIGSYKEGTRQDNCLVNAETNWSLKYTRQINVRKLSITTLIFPPTMVMLLEEENKIT